MLLFSVVHMLNHVEHVDSVHRAGERLLPEIPQLPADIWCRATRGVISELLDVDVGANQLAHFISDNGRSESVAAANLKHSVLAREHLGRKKISRRNER